MAREDPAAARALEDAAAAAAAFLARHRPEATREHAAALRTVEPSYVLPGGCFTSGIVNANNQLPWHVDRGNRPGLWSVMLMVQTAGGVRGGELVFPEWGLAFDLPDGTHAMFEGGRWVHGVAPFQRTQAKQGRYTIVWYALQAIWRCLPIGDELRRIREVKTRRERKRVG